MASAVLVTWSSSAAAGDPTIAREQLKLGYALAQEGRCDEAVAHLAESERLDPKAITLINLASCEEKLGRLGAAMIHWVEARARAQTEAASAIEAEATRRALALEVRLPRLTIALAPSAPKDAVVFRDGIELGPPSLGIALPLDPGAHAVTVKASGRADAITSVTLGEGEAKAIEVDAGAPSLAPTHPAATSPEVPPQAPRATVHPLTFVGFGVAGVALGAGTITGLLALSAGKSAKVACPALQCDANAYADIEAGRTLGTASTISFALAGVAAGAGLYGLLFPARAAASPPKPAVGLTVGPSAIVLRGRL
jgi:hypothetical protein